MRLVGEAGEVNVNEAEEEMEALRHGIRGYKPSNIFNMDETALFYKSIPNRSFFLKGEKRNGIKQMKAKERITVVLCANTTGDCKISPVVIGSSKRPRCFTIDPGSFYGRSPDGHAIFPPHPLRFELKFAHLFSILGKVRSPIITSVSLSNLENLDY